MLSRIAWLRLSDLQRSGIGFMLQDLAGVVRLSGQASTRSFYSLRVKHMVRLVRLLAKYHDSIVITVVCRDPHDYRIQFPT